MPTSAFKKRQMCRENLSLFFLLCPIKITKVEKFMQINESEGKAC